MLNTAVDWTQGCVATGSDTQIEQIAAWIRKEKPSRIFIGPDGVPPSDLVIRSKSAAAPVRR